LRNDCSNPVRRSAATASNVSDASNARTVIVDTAGPSVESWSPKSKKVSPRAKPTVTHTEKGSTLKAVLKPTKRLKAGAKYKATVTTAAEDAAGNALVTDKSWSFKVKR
jgi:hypothetical protein